MSEGMKSAYELAMERLDKEQGKVKHLTDDQKDRMAQIDGMMKAKLAEVELSMERRFTEALQSGDPAKVKDVETERLRDIARIKEDAETEKEAVRNE